MSNGRIRALLVTVIEGKDYKGAAHITFTGEVVTSTLAAERIKNVREWMYDDASDTKHTLPDGAFEDWQALVVAAADFNALEPYGHEQAFRPSVVRQPDAERYTRVFKHLERFDRKQDHEYGPAESLGAWFARQALATGSERVLIKFGGDGSLYSENEYRAYKPGEAVWKINRLLEAWQDAVKKGEVA